MKTVFQVWAQVNNDPRELLCTESTYKDALRRGRQYLKHWNSRPLLPLPGNGQGHTVEFQIEESQRQN